MDFPCPVAASVDRGYLCGKHEPHFCGATGGRGALQPLFGFLAEPEQARFGGDQRLAQLLRPARVREVTRSDNRYPLAARPPGQMLEIAVPAAGAGEPRVDVQVGVEHTSSSALPLLSAAWPIRYCHAGPTGRGGCTQWAGGSEGAGGGGRWVGVFAFIGPCRRPG